MRKDTLQQGDYLITEQRLYSQDSNLNAILQNDGNFVIYHLNTPIWASNTCGQYVHHLLLQNDGNLVLYGLNRKPIWASNTRGDNNRLVLQNDGNLVLYSKNNDALFSSGSLLFNYNVNIALMTKNIKKISPYLTVYQYERKLRLGINQDGGYIIGDLKGSYDCYISAGVQNEESFTRDFIEKYASPKEQNFAFDGTIENYPYEYTDKINWYKKNIGSFHSDLIDNLVFFTENYKDIFLKMDIEGSEFEWLNVLDLKNLSSFKQLVIEFHGITDDSYGCLFDFKLKCLQKLCLTHNLIHAHGNNHSQAISNIPTVIELTFIRKSEFLNEPCLNKLTLPTPGLDYPNTPSRQDYDLDFPPFVFK